MSKYPREHTRGYDPVFLGLDPPESGPTEEPARCLKINRAWANILVQLCESIVNPYVWNGTDEEKWAAYEQAELLRLELMKGNCELMVTDIRNKPDNSCVLQYSKDHGVTWQDGFDFSCITKNAGPSDSEVENFIENNNSYYQQIINNYDGTVGSVAPDLVYDGSSDDDLRDKALCFGTKLFVKQLAAFLVKAKDGSNQGDIDALSWASWAIGLGGAVGLVLAASGIALSPWIAVGLALAGVGAGLGGLVLNKLDNVTSTELDDETIQENIACCLYNALKGSTWDKLSFTTALDNNCGYGEATPEYRIIQVIKPFLAKDETHAMFLDAMSSAFVVAQNGKNLPCDCDEPTCDQEASVTSFSIFPSNMETSPVFIPQAINGEDLATLPGEQVTIFLDGEYCIKRVQLRTYMGSDLASNYWYSMTLEAGQNIASDTIPLVDGEQTYDFNFAMFWSTDRLVLSRIEGGAFLPIHEVKIYHA